LVPEVLEYRRSGTEKYDWHRERRPPAHAARRTAPWARDARRHAAALGPFNRILLPIAGFFDRLRGRTVTN
jgi:hypothetical protein